MSANGGFYPDLTTTSVQPMFTTSGTTVINLGTNAMPMAPPAAPPSLSDRAWLDAEVQGVCEMAF